MLGSILNQTKRSDSKTLTTAPAVYYIVAGERQEKPHVVMMDLSL